MDSTENESRGVIAERLDHLFATVRPGTRPYTLKEVADGINARLGERLLTVQYLSQLRRGDRDQPSLRVLQAIADWFGIHYSYFTAEDVTRPSADELRVRKLMQDTDLRTIMFRSDGISPPKRKMILDMLETIREAEGLPPAQADTPRPPGPESTGS